MPENTNASQDATLNDASTQGATPNTQATTETVETTTTSTETLTPEQLQAKIEKLEQALSKANNESKTHRLKAKELDDLKAKQEAEQLTETQRLQKERDDARKAHEETLAQLKETKLSAEITRVAAQLGFNDPTDARRFLDTADLDVDDAGNPTNVDTLLKALLKSRSYLADKGKSTSVSSGGATNPSRSTTSGPLALSDAVIAKMSRDEYLQRRQEIQAWRLANPPRF